MNISLMMPLPRANLALGKAAGDPGEGLGVALLGQKGVSGATVLRERHHLSLANGAALDATYRGSYDGNANLFKEQMTLTGPEVLISRVLSGAFQRPHSRVLGRSQDAAPCRRRHSANCVEAEHERESVADASEVAMSEGDDDDSGNDSSSVCSSSWPKGGGGGGQGSPLSVSPSLSPDDRWWGREEGSQEWAWVEARWLGFRRLRRQIPPALEEKLQKLKARGWGRGRLRGLEERMRGLNLGLGSWRAPGHARASRDMCRSCSLTFSSDDTQQTPSGKLEPNPPSVSVVCSSGS